MEEWSGGVKKIGVMEYSKEALFRGRKPNPLDHLSKTHDFL
jgi:hypothetical protein